MHKGLLHTAHENVPEEELEGQVDWRTEGAVSDVKDQGEFLNIFAKKWYILVEIVLFWIENTSYGSFSPSKTNSGLVFFGGNL